MSNLGLGLLWMLCALWMVQEICALLSTNQIQSFSQVQFCHFFLPHALGVCLFLLQVLMGAMLYFLSSDGLLWVLWFWFYCTQSKKTVQKGEYSQLMLTAVFFFFIKIYLPQIPGQFVFCQKKFPCTPILHWNFPWTISAANKNGRGRNFSNNFWTFFLEFLSFVMIMVQKNESQQIIRF